jgi:hypothetical protein
MALQLMSRLADSEVYVVAPAEADVHREDPDPETPVRVLDAGAGELRGPVYFGSLLARKPRLTQYQGDEGELETLMEDVEPVEGTAPKGEIGEVRIRQ